MLIHGRCHCGNIAYTLTWEPDPTEIPARACSCSFCTRHGGVWTSDPAGRLDVTVGDQTLVSHYAFGTKTAEFHICANCGIVPVVTSRVDGRVYAVVNVNTFVERPVVALASQRVGLRGRGRGHTPGASRAQLDRQRHLLGTRRNGRDALMTRHSSTCPHPQLGGCAQTSIR